MRTAILCLVLAGCAATEASAPPTQFTRIHELGPDEGVFAYARISPDGRFLAYASERRDPARASSIVQTVRVLDIESGQAVFEEPGIDAYWSVDGGRMIWLSRASGRTTVSIRDHATGEVTRDVAPVALGDYFSWAVIDGRDRIMTIRGRYYHLDGAMAELPASSIPACGRMGTGERPLISKDGRRATVFVSGRVVVRNVEDCEDIFDTGLEGAKADFSFDGRYIAFHAPKRRGRGYEIRVVDLADRTARTVTSLPGSSLFPSWTRDGRLSFRYESDDYRGFLMADDVLAATAEPLAGRAAPVSTRSEWVDVFPETPAPAHAITLVMVWGIWSAHSPDALAALARARDVFAERSWDVGVLTATDPASPTHHVEALLDRYGVELPRIPLAAERFTLTEAHNQIPTVLLFRGSELVDRRLGPQSAEELHDWVTSVRNAGRTAMRPTGSRR